MRYNKKSSTATVLKDYFNEIRKAFGEMQREIDAEVDRTLTTLARDKSRLRDEAFEIEKNELERNLTNAMASYHSICETSIRPYFALIRDVIAEWALAKPSPELIDMMKIYKDFDVTPTAAEMGLMLSQGAGNYMSMKLLSAMGQNAGISIADNPGLDEINRMIDKAESDTVSSIFSCAGTIEDNRIPGAEYLEVQYPFWSTYNSAVFLTDERETELDRLEKLLAENTQSVDSAIELTPAKKSEIDELFADCPDEASRIELAKKLLETDYAFDGILRKYDAKLYQATLSAMADTADAEIEEIKKRKKMLEADETAEKLKAVNARSALARSTASAS